jgi:WD repeat and SOF domain-containing protein 1
MKIKTISRPDNHSRSTDLDIYKVSRNLDPTLHPFERAREYTRALNATKLERLFSKPFLASLEGHIDGVYCLAKHASKTTLLASGSADGEIRFWSLDSNTCTWYLQNAHKGFVNSIVFSPLSNNYSAFDSANINDDTLLDNHSTRLLSAGSDKFIKLWEISKKQPIAHYLTPFSISGIDHHASEPLFVTCSTRVDLYNYQRSEPIHTFQWGSETIKSVKMNASEKNIFASCGSDNSIVLYDIRTTTPLSKVIMGLRTNAICWNPQEPLNFSTVFFYI